MSFMERKCTATEKKETNPGESAIDIKVTKNGPYIVTGKIPLFEQIIVVDKEGIPVEWGMGKKFPEKEKCGLCRCGESKNKPYCDGTHVKINFDGTEETIEPYLKQAEVIEGPRAQAHRCRRPLCFSQVLSSRRRNLESCTKIR